MGTFAGHALPGSFFLVFAIWWTVQIFRRYFRSLQKNGAPYKSTATFQSSCLCGRLKNFEIEGCVKIFFTLVGFTLEIITAHKNGKFVHFGNAQHATMFFFFGMTGVLDLLMFYKVPLPKKTEYVGAVLALSVEGLLFSMHLHGRTDMDKQLHWLLVYTVIANIAVMISEMRFQHSVILALGRAFLFLCQGTWFWQVGWILYPPFGGKHWEENDPEQMMITVMIFTWHLGVNFIFILAVGAIIGALYRCKGEFGYDGYDQLNMQLLNKNSNGHTTVNLDEDSESDLEFQKPLPISK